MALCPLFLSSRPSGHRPEQSLRSLRATIASIALMMGTGVAHAASFQDIGHLSSSKDLSEAHAISADGRVVVGIASFGGRRGLQAFRWTAETGMVGLGTLSPTVNSAYSSAQAVSADGSVVVGLSVVLSSTTRSLYQAFRWSVADGMVALPHEAAGYAYLSDATGVSGDGTVIVGRGMFDSQHGEGFRWEEATGITAFGDLPNGSVDTGAANAISSDGLVVVGASTRGPFRWDAAGGFLELTGPGGLPGSARAVSADGSVVVGAMREGTFLHAFRWDAATGMTGLSNWRIPVDQSEATAVSGDGSIFVGHAWSYQEGDFAFVWDAEHGLRRLRDVLTELGVDLTGWTLRTATGISADGSTIVGNGFDPEGNQAAWIAVIPEPGPALLTVLGIALLAGFGKERKRAADR